MRQRARGAEPDPDASRSPCNSISRSPSRARRPGAGGERRPSRRARPARTAATPTARRGRARAATATTRSAVARGRREAHVEPVARAARRRGRAGRPPPRAPPRPGARRSRRTRAASSGAPEGARARRSARRLTATSTSARSGSSPPDARRRSACSRRSARPVDPPGGHEPRGEAGDRGLAHLREGVVRARGERAQRHVAARARHDAMGAVAAEHDDRRAPRARAIARDRAAVSAPLAVERASRAPPAPGRARAPCGARRAARGCSARAEAVAGRHHQHALDARGAQPRHQAAHHRALLGVVEHRGAGDEAADVPPRGRVGDDADRDLLHVAPRYSSGASGRPARAGPRTPRGSGRSGPPRPPAPPPRSGSSGPNSVASTVAARAVSVRRAPDGAPVEDDRALEQPGPRRLAGEDDLEVPVGDDRLVVHRDEERRGGAARRGSGSRAAYHAVAPCVLGATRARRPAISAPRVGAGSRLAPAGEVANGRRPVAGEVAPGQLGQRRRRGQRWRRRARARRAARRCTACRAAGRCRSAPPARRASMT